LESALVAPPLCENLADYLRRIDLALEVMQERAHLVRIAQELVEDWAADGVIYGEVRFAPQLHRRRGLALQEIVNAVHEGLQEGAQKHSVHTGLILCCLRHENPIQSLEIAKLAADNRDKICALDLAGDEARFPGAMHADAFRLAHKAGLRCTVHAGEASGAESVREALELLGAERVGHGARAEESSEIVSFLQRRGIPLEMCPCSNVQTRAVASLTSHPIDRLFRRGVRVTVSTDARTVSDTTVTSEFEHLAKVFGWGPREFWICQRHAAEAAFTSAEIRAELLHELTSFQAVGSAGAVQN
jgi:adenosine deaminase